MTWRLHLTNQAIQYIDIVQNVVASWSRRSRVVFHSLETGTALPELILQTPDDSTDRQGEAWQEFMATLVAPNGTALPVIHLRDMTIYLTEDGRMRLYHTGDADLWLESDGSETQLDKGDATAFVTLALDRFLGLCAALDRQGKLHIYQQHIAVGTFDLGLKLQGEMRPAVAISHGGGSVYVSDGQRVVLTDSSGVRRRELSTHYAIRLMACSPDGRFLATCDLETGVVRVYTGADLALSYQRFAIDLVAEATQVQLLADMPPHSVAPSAMSIDNAGTLAFSMGGVICVTDLSHMDKLPRPQALL